MGAIKYQIDADARKAIDQLSKTNAKLQEQMSKLKGVKRESRKAGTALGGVAGKAAGFFKLATAVGLATKALSEYQQQSEAAATSRSSHEAGYKQIGQLAGGSDEKFDTSIGTVAYLMKKYGYTEGQAIDFKFAGGSLEFSEEEIKRLGRFKAVSANPIPLLTGVAKSAAAFGDTTMGGSSESRLNTGMSVSTSTEVPVEELFPESATSAQSVKMLGGTGTENIAAVGVLAVPMKGVNIAATGLRALAGKMFETKKFREMGLTGGLEELFSYTPARLDRVLGDNKEARIVLEAFRGPQFDKFKRVILAAEIEQTKTGTPDSMLNQQVALMERKLGAMQRDQRASGVLAVSEQSRAKLKLERSAVRKVVQARLNEMGAGAVVMSADANAMGFAEWLGMGHEGLLDVGARTVAEYSALPGGEPYRGLAFQKRRLQAMLGGDVGMDGTYQADEETKQLLQKQNDLKEEGNRLLEEHLSQGRLSAEPPE